MMDKGCFSFGWWLLWWPSIVQCCVTAGSSWEQAFKQRIVIVFVSIFILFLCNVMKYDLTHWLNKDLVPLKMKLILIPLWKTASWNTYEHLIFTCHFETTRAFLNLLLRIKGLKCTEVSHYVLSWNILFNFHTCSRIKLYEQNTQSITHFFHLSLG